MELLERFRSRYPFPLDDFQVEAIRSIEAGQSVIVSAPTGAGKTLVAEFAIHAALAAGRRLAYTTPLKALSNQKFADFTRAFGADTVGILTGDVKVNPHAPILVMTTEILRNALYGSGLDGLRYIVLDECHYMGDEGRGTVWEEIIVAAPDDVVLVGLSATVANVKEIADWISIVHRPIVPIYHPHRPVPLAYVIADLAGEIHEVDRVRCERAMQDGLTEGKSLLGGPQQREVDTAIGELIRESPTVAESVLNQSVFEALRLGIGLHHAGILPSVKRLIEVLFERGFCRAVFATETMALGIHMPARSVVLQGITKRTDRGFRALSHNELTQMAGRAGRRGIDPEGTCVVALDARDGLDDLLRVIDGSPEPIESQFKLGYGSVALLLSTGAPPDALRRRIESSFGQYQNLKRIREVETDVRTLEASLEELRRYPAPCGDFQRIGRYRRARHEIEARRHALGRGGGKRGERTVAEAEPGRLVLVRRGGAPTLAMVLGIHAIRGHRVLIDALLPHGATVRVKSGVIKRVFWATPPLHVPRDRRQDGRDGGRDRHGHERDGRDRRGTDGRALRNLAAELERLSVAELIDRERAQGPEAALSAIECHRCPWGATARCDREWRELETVTERLSFRRRQLEALRGAYWQEFLRVVETLEQFGAVRDRRLEDKGRLIAGLRHDNELLVAEGVAQGVFDDVSGPEAAAVCSALIEEARSGDPALARTFLKKRPKLKRKLDQLMRVADTVHEAQRARHLRIPIAVHSGFMPAVFRWASGEDDWSGIVEEAFGGHEGDLIRAMRRLIDLLRQLADSPEVRAETARVLAHAARVIDRGIVLESALI